jgi:DNA-binding transcriptional ArsR family regulator
MPNPAQDFIVPEIPPVTVSLEPVPNVLQSLWLLIDAENKTGLGDWVIRTAAALTLEEREINRLILIGFYYVVIPEQNWPSFPAYLDHLTTCDPVVLRDKMLETYAQILPPLDNGECQDMLAAPPSVDWEMVLESADTYLDFLHKHFGTDHIDDELEARAYSYIVDPPAMQEMIVSHLRSMWERFLAAEWERTEPMLRDAVTAFRQIDLSGMSRLEAMQLITGQSSEATRWVSRLEEVEHVSFVPTAHIGPYLGAFSNRNTLWIFFGARIPKGVQFYAPDLSRAEIVVRLNALADDTRLRILKLISEEGEQSSQDIMQSLDLSQSAASRHLKQLSATGHLIERRCSGAKCYKLNPERIKDTLQAISTFLLGS